MKSVRRAPFPLNTLAFFAGLSSCTCRQRQSGRSCMTMLFVASLLKEACHKHPLHLHATAGRKHAKGLVMWTDSCSKQHIW